MAPSVFRLASWLASAVVSVSAAPLQPRAVIGHDAVVGFPETVPSGTIGNLYLKYKPYLKVVNGCVPFPAVDSAGNTGYVLAHTALSPTRKANTHSQKAVASPPPALPTAAAPPTPAKSTPEAVPTTVPTP